MTKLLALESFSDDPATRAAREAPPQPEDTPEWALGVAAGRAEGYDAGRADGLREAAESVATLEAARRGAAIDAVEQAFAKAALAQTEAARTARAEAMTLVRAALGAALPRLAETAFAEEVARFVETELTRLEEAPKADATLRVAPAHLEAIQEMAASTPALADVRVIGAPELQGPAVQLSLAAARAELDIGRALAELDALLTAGAEAPEPPSEAPTEVAPSRQSRPPPPMRKPAGGVARAGG